MKQNLIFLLDADADCAGIALEAGARTGRSVRICQNCREAFQFVENEICDAAGVIIDADPEAHGMAVLEAINALPCPPPVILLTDAEEAYMKPVAMKHGASACLGKPVSINRLKAVIDETIGRNSHHPTCDAWGHLIACAV